MLRDKTWRIRYTPDDGDLVRLFYIPALQDAVRYHRLTGYFNAGALALAARGIEGLVRNSGQARLLVRDDGLVHVKVDALHCVVQ